MARTRSGSSRSSTTDLDCDYYGTSLHKWILAPIGTGMLYVRKNKIADIWPMMAAPTIRCATNIRKFEEIGTHPASQRNAITEAMNFHESIGRRAKSGAFSLSAEAVVGSAATAARGEDSEQRRSRAVVRHRIYQRGWYRRGEVAARCGRSTGSGRGVVTPGEYQGLRITPNVYTTLEEIDTFAEVMAKIINAGSLPAS